MQAYHSTNYKLHHTTTHHQRNANSCSFHVVHHRHHEVLLFFLSSFFRKSLLGDTNDTASRTSASVASLLALLVLTLAEVVGAGVDDDGAAEDALGADQLDELVRDGALGVALSIGLEVAQVADVALAVGGGAVGLVVGVDCGGRMVLDGCGLGGLLLGSRLTVRTGAGAAVGVVTEGVDVHATLGVGVVAGDVPGDLGLGGLGGLLEGDGALDVGVTTDNSDCEEEVSCQPLQQVCASSRQPVRARRRSQCR